MERLGVRRSKGLVCCPSWPYGAMMDALHSGCPKGSSAIGMRLCCAWDATGGADTADVLWVVVVGRAAHVVCCIGFVWSRRQYQ